MYVATTLLFAYSKASATDMRPLRSVSALASLNASAKYWANTGSFFSPPVLVDVTIVRPGPASGWTNAPLELAVLTKTMRCALIAPSSLA